MHYFNIILLIIAAAELPRSSPAKPTNYTKLNSSYEQYVSKAMVGSLFIDIFDNSAWHYYPLLHEYTKDFLLANEGK
jgi:hypothetical protein